MKKRVAIFDIDGTVFRSSLFIELTEGLIAAGLMPANTVRSYARARAKWMDRRGSYDDYIGAMVRAFMGRIKGIPARDFLRVARRVVASSGDHVYRYTRDLVCRLKRRGYYLVAISSSPKDVLDPFCRKWGFDKVYGRLYEKDAKGRLSGRILFLDIIKDKAKVLKRVVRKENLTLKGSVGVGDSEADIPFLALVSTPICFNPNSILLRAAKRRGWKVVVERKDVVYEL
jgi:HAD superfamily hydrolase (TIGR01490 family)